ncbi:MAG: hypothetical protein Q4B84_01545 [Clostridia bacterium]|nr:hypothetical protein [Clostridia bacterium]
MHNMRKGKFFQCFILLLSLMLPLNSFSVYALGNPQLMRRRQRLRKIHQEVIFLKKCVDERGGDVKSGVYLYKDFRGRCPLCVLSAYYDAYMRDKCKYKTKTNNDEFNDELEKKMEMEVEIDNTNKMSYTRKKINIFFVGPERSGKTWFANALSGQGYKNLGSVKFTERCEYNEWYLRYNNNNKEFNEVKSFEDSNLVIRLFSTSGMEKNLDFLSEFYVDKGGRDAANIVIFTIGCDGYLRSKIYSQNNPNAAIKGTYDSIENSPCAFPCYDLSAVIRKYYKPWLKKTNNYIFLCTQMDRFTERFLKICSNNINNRGLENLYKTETLQTLRSSFNYDDEICKKIRYVYLEDDNTKVGTYGKECIFEEIKNYIKEVSGYDQLEDYIIDDDYNEFGEINYDK